MGQGRGSGKERAREAALLATSSPLLEVRGRAAGKGWLARGLVEWLAAGPAAELGKRLAKRLAGGPGNGPTEGPLERLAEGLA